jgi:hypothetical protein
VYTARENAAPDVSAVTRLLLSSTVVREKQKAEARGRQINQNCKIKEREKEMKPK